MRSLLIGLSVGSAFALAAAPQALADGPPGPPPHHHHHRVLEAREAAGPADYPPAARPGECFAKVLIPATTETVTEQVMVKPAHRERRFVAAVFDWAERGVLVAPERHERRVTPATYHMVTEEEVVTPATVRIDHTEPVYENVSEQVMVRPAHAEWRREYVGPNGVIPADSDESPTGEVMCLVRVPAEYATEDRRVLREPSRTVETAVPAVTREVTRQVIDTPEQVEMVDVPAVYRTEKYQRLVTPAHVEEQDVPAQFAARQHQHVTSPEHFEWRQVDCVPDPAAQGRREHHDPR